MAFCHGMDRSDRSSQRAPVEICIGVDHAGEANTTRTCIPLEHRHQLLPIELHQLSQQAVGEGIVS